jgi:uroporphyrinogen decarboxylase
MMMPTRSPLSSNAWKDGVDEWGRVWKNGTYAGGVLDTESDLRQYSPPLTYAREFFDEDEVREVRKRYPDHCLIFGSHIGPFTAAYMAMGFTRFFTRLTRDRRFVQALLERRTEWCIAMFRKAVELGAEILVLGDDGAHKTGPMISPRAWRELVLPLHRQITGELSVPVVWHSDGNVEPLLPLAAEAGFVGVHGLEPAAGMDLRMTKQRFGKDLVLIGNVDTRALCGSDLLVVRKEVERCMTQGAPRGRYMIATCNSIFKGMNPLAVAEMFRCESELGAY